jgi:hypothetical protein
MQIYILAYPLKARILKPAETAVARNSTVITRDLVLSMQSAPRSYSNRHERNFKGTTGSSVLCESVQMLCYMCETYT